MSWNAGAGRWRRRLALAGSALLVLPLLWLSPYLASGTERVKLRNAVWLAGELPPAFDWSAAPAHGPAPTTDDSDLAGVVDGLGLAALPDDGARAVAIATHLLTAQPTLRGGPVRESLRRTYDAITTRGDGYCNDFIRVFQALAEVAGLETRVWAFAFDGFGGHGHIFVEVWNHEAGRWALLDVFNNYRFRDAANTGDDAPLAAAAFRRVVAERPDDLVLEPLAPAARPGWTVRDKALAYYRRGLDQWYQLDDGSVLAAEASPVFRSLAPVSYSLAQAASTLAGAQPQVWLLATDGNHAMVADLHRLRRTLGWCGASLAVGAAVLMGAVLWPRGRA